MKVEQIRYDSNSKPLQSQTSGVSTMLPEDKIVDLYTLGRHTRKPLETVQLHQTVYGAPIISLTFASPANDGKGRDSSYNRTFLVSLKDVTASLLEALRPFSQDKIGRLEPLRIGKLTIHHANSPATI